MVNIKYNKYIYLDSGLLLRMLDGGLGAESSNIKEILLGYASDLVNKGSITEMVVGWEIVKSYLPEQNPELFYWENTKNGATSEVDYITSKNGKILPIEVKSGTSGKMKSLFLFMENKQIYSGIRTSLENFGTIEHTSPSSGKKYEIQVAPIYALSNFLNL